MVRKYPEKLAMGRRMICRKYIFSFRSSRAVRSIFLTRLAEEYQLQQSLAGFIKRLDNAGHAPQSSWPWILGGKALNGLRKVRSMLR